LRFTLGPLACADCASAASVSGFWNLVMARFSITMRVGWR
jgi:hypothetical protein